MGTRHYVRPERKPGEKNVFLDAIWALLTPVIILGGIYSGVFSPTESAAVACVYALIVGTCIYKELTLKKIYNALFNAMKGSVAVMFLCTCATFFGWLLTYLGTTNQIINFLTETISSKLALFLIIDLIVLISGMFVDGGTIILIVGPLVCPAAAALGMSRRMVSYYRTARKPIPRHVWLACLGWDAAGCKDGLPLSLPGKVA